MGGQVGTVNGQIEQTSTLNEKMSIWKVLQAQADALKAEILTEAETLVTAGKLGVGDKMTVGGAVLEYSAGKGSYNYEKAVVDWQPENMEQQQVKQMMIRINSKTFVDWRSVWLGSGRPKDAIDAYYTPGIPRLELKFAKK